MNKICKSPYGNYYVLRIEGVGIDRIDEFPTIEVVENIIQGLLDYYGTDCVYNLHAISFDLLNGNKVKMRFCGNGSMKIIDGLVYFD